MGFVRDIWRAILFELKKLVLGVGVGVVLLLLNLLRSRFAQVTQVSCTAKD
ncbi:MULTISPECIES: hypothetical protein [unclassified Coleofasciculus]|uniref:hypothetical protein n=1 Tax=unclassified Coleofasciculus TaxID=2692782 RepID=UPI00187F2138|nr:MULTISPECIES: hypothetical protein [unclassified Coleofasciculus]MBE9126101.1 hypothetical protein [Coleofasciculus sp. LEGE 07081]MBE9147544.1 hypothetical protein [Coleofasciculus sp. LEGE 07092]